MPIIHNIPLNLDIEHVLRHQGMSQRSRRQPQIMAMVHEFLSTESYLPLLEPAIAYKLHSITDRSPDYVYLSDDKVLHGRLIPSVLPSAKELALILCTIGPKLEKEVAELFEQNEPLRGTLLDGIGSAAMDSLAEEACQIIQKEASSRGYQASSPLNPGMPGLPISEQQHLFELVPAEEIGVHLTPLQIMIPRKSVSMVIGIGQEMSTWTRAEACGRCNLNKTCRYKIHVTT